MLNSDSAQPEINTMVTNSKEIDFSNLEDQINLIKSNEVLPNNNVSHHDIHQYSIMYITLACLAAWVIYYISTKIKQRRRSIPTPTPRTLHPIPTHKTHLSTLHSEAPPECLST